MYARLCRIVCFTLAEALLSTLLALVIGLAAAFFVAKRRFIGRGVLASLSSVPLCVPPMFIALGFILCYGTNGAVTRLLSSVTRRKFTFLYSFWGLVLVQGFYNFPIVMRTVADSWQHEMQERVEAAMLLGASRARIFLTITFFHLKSAILAASSLVFLYCFFSFIIVLLLGNLAAATIEVEIYSACRVQMNFHYAAVLSLIETSCALAVVALHTLGDRINNQSKGLAPSAPLARVSSRMERAVLAVLLFLIAAFLIAPMAAIGVNAFIPKGSRLPLSFAPFVKLLGRASFYHALINTLLIAAATSALSTALGTAAALFMRFRYRGVFLRVIVMLPLALSPIVMSFCWMCILRTTSPLVLVLAQTSLEWPFAYRQVAASAERISSAIADCALVLSPRPLFAVRSVFIPLCFRGILSAFAFTFAISAGDAAIPLMLAVPRFETLSLYLYRLSGAYRFAESSCCAIILCLLTAGVFALGERRGRARGKWVVVGG